LHYADVQYYYEVYVQQLAKGPASESGWYIVHRFTCIVTKLISLPSGRSKLPS